MEIKLNKEERIALKYADCPRCHKTLNAWKRWMRIENILVAALLVWMIILTIN